MRALRIPAALAFVAALVLACGQGALTAPEELDVPAPLFVVNEDCQDECDPEDQGQEGEDNDEG